MEMGKELAKERKVNHIKVSSLLFVVFTAFFWSCETEKEEVLIEINEPDEVTLNTPTIQTPSPLIHLADNLDEQDQLGWCIDTRGIGFNEMLHVHSCKANGGDVQFFYNEETKQICSAEYDNFCVEMSGGPVEGMNLSLVESNTDSSDQKFIYDEDTGEFKPEANTNLCLAAGSTSAAAGIYMSRSLTLELSSETAERLKRWVIVSN